jgi:hypothetical protein
MKNIFVEMDRALEVPSSRFKLQLFATITGNTGGGGNLGKNSWLLPKYRVGFAPIKYGT